MDLENNELYNLAEHIVKQIVDLISEKKYNDIPQLAELVSWSVENIEEAVDGFLELNELPYIDRFDIPCNFHPQYEYHQLHCIIYRDGSGLHVDYDLTTDSELNDLTLQMELLFLGAESREGTLADDGSKGQIPRCVQDGIWFTGSDMVKARILDVHVM